MPSSVASIFLKSYWYITKHKKQAEVGNYLLYLPRDMGDSRAGSCRQESTAPPPWTRQHKHQLQLYSTTRSHGWLTTIYVFDESTGVANGRGPDGALDLESSSEPSPSSSVRSWLPSAVALWPSCQYVHMHISLNLREIKSAKRSLLHKSDTWKQ